MVRWQNVKQTSFFAFPRIVPFGRPLAPNILACSVLTISIKLLLNAVLSAWVQTLFLPFLPSFPFPLSFPLLNLPVTWRRWQSGFEFRTEDPGTGFPVSVTHQQYPVPVNKWFVKFQFRKQHLFANLCGLFSPTFVALDLLVTTIFIARRDKNRDSWFVTRFKSRPFFF